MAEQNGRKVGAVLVVGGGVGGMQAAIDLAAVRANAELAGRLAGERDVIAVVKADAYGHGAVAVARAVAEREAPGEDVVVATVETDCVSVIDNPIIRSHRRFKDSLRFVRTGIVED